MSILVFASWLHFKRLQRFSFFFFKRAETHLYEVCNEHMSSGDFYSLDHWFNLLWYTLIKTIKSTAIRNYELLANVTHKQNIDWLEMSHKSSRQERWQSGKKLLLFFMSFMKQHYISIEDKHSLKKGGKHRRFNKCNFTRVYG